MAATLVICGPQRRHEKQRTPIGVAKARSVHILMREHEADRDTALALHSLLEEFAEGFL